MPKSQQSLLMRAARRLFRPHGSVVRLGEYVTFRPEGFVSAPDPGSLLCRHYYEVKQLQHFLGQLAGLGVRAGRSLEIGCGYGRLSPYIAEHFEQHTAVDINGWALSEASRFYPGITFSESSATELPFPSHRFDVVITWTVLQHIPNHLVGKALSEIARVEMWGPATRPKLACTRKGLWMIHRDEDASGTTRGRWCEYRIAPLHRGHQLAVYGDCAAARE